MPGYTHLWNSLDLGYSMLDKTPIINIIITNKKHTEIIFVMIQNIKISISGTYWLYSVQAYIKVRCVSPHLLPGEAVSHHHQGSSNEDC